jgi:phosphate uptake regulator
MEAIVVFILAGLGGYLGSYVQQKGKNLATKEDIAVITKLEEDVRQQYRLILEQGTRKHQLRLAALDRRLEAHQQAYALWRDLMRVANIREEIGDVVMKCQDWFFRNCLYLDAEAREAFWKAFMAAGSRPVYLSARVPRSDEDMKTLERNWSLIENAGEAIVKGVDLPSIAGSDAEVKPPPG